MPIEQLRNLLIIALCVVSFLIWQQWRLDYGPKPASTTAEAPSGEPPGAPSAAPAVPSDLPVAPSTGTTREDVPRSPATLTPPGAPAASAAAHGPRVQVTTDLFRAEIDPAGGGLVLLALFDYPVSHEQPDVPFDLLKDDPPDVFLAQSGLLGEPAAPNHHAQFTFQATDYTLAAGADTLEVPLTWSGPDGLRVQKVYRFRRDSYVIDVSYRISNGGDTPWRGSMYGQFQRSLPPKKGGGFLRTTSYTYTGGVISGPDKPYEKIKFSDMESTDLDRSTTGGWAAMIQHYFTGAWVPAQDVPTHYYTKALADGRYVLGVIGPQRTVAPGETADLDLRLYAGPKVAKRLQHVAPHLERTVDYGWLWLIAEPLFWLLQHIHGVLGNWGFSIIVLTMLIKLAFFHLSATSYKSMARMRKLQPRIVALRERYASDKPRMNQAMMDLYKKEKINPLGGCLPIVVQIPVFIALYWVLLESVELRQAPFVLWVKDLSVRDPYYVLPILMGVTMLVQQKLNPAPPDPIQAKVMMALPFVFTFLFLGFPSGLVLYWFVNNLLSIAQQWVITRKIVGPG